MTTSLTDRFRFLARSGQREKTAIRAEVPASQVAAGVAVMRLYDPIDSWGDWFGVSAKEFVAALDELPDTTSEIRLHINSPGGEVHEALAILNALRAHPARAVAVVDGLAASAASFIAAGLDELVMARNSELMCHDAWGLCFGNAADMAKMAGDLGRFSDNIASIYAEKSGGTVEQWRELMAAETWLSADEAVTAGLADRVDVKPADDAAKARFDLSVFAYAGRAKAPAPTTPVASATGPAAPAGGPTPKEDATMADTLLDSLRKQHGLADDADEATVLAANQAALDTLEELNDKPAETGEQAATVAAALAEVTRVSTELAEMKARAAQKDKGELFASWLRDGKTSKAELTTLEATYDAAPAQTAALVNARAKGSVVPVDSIGQDTDSDLSDETAFEARLTAAGLAL